MTCSPRLTHASSFNSTQRSNDLPGVQAFIMPRAEKSRSSRLKEVLPSPVNRTPRRQLPWVTKEVLPSPVNRTTLHPPERTKSHNSSIARNDYLSCVNRKTPKKDTHSVAEDVHTSFVEHRSRHPSDIAKRILNSTSKDVHQSTTKPKTAYLSRSAQRSLARLSKKRVYNQADTKPIYFPYAQCVCDLEQDSDGEDKLPHAKYFGKAMYILDDDGTQVTSCAHLPGCVRFVVEYPVKYDPATIASDFLRAIGSHPHQPALNQYWNKMLETELQAISILKGG